MNVLGLDIGGANLKAALSDRSARSQSFALWKHPQDLASALRKLVAGWAWDRVAVTMTGELCDCFETKRVGVLTILEAVRQVFGGAIVWRTDGRFVNLDEARVDPLPCAAANWLALATFAGRYCPASEGLLLDIGSTTTDIIRLADGVPQPRGRTDTERLRSGELVYCGMRRTPLCAILGLDGMAEFFATTHDIGLILGDIAEDTNDCDTADQRPATREFALARAARMIGADLESMAEHDIKGLSESLRERQLTIIRNAVQRVVPAIENCTAIISGAGEMLGRKVAAPAKRVISLSDMLGVELSIAACAYAITCLASVPPRPPVRP